MHTTNMNRRELLDLITGRRRDGAQGSLEIEQGAQAGQQMTVIWREEDDSPGGTLPRVIALPREAQQEFLAWAYTYLAALRPFTAFVRLLDPVAASELLHRDSTQDLGRFREAFVSLIICESIGRLGPRPDSPQQLTPSACVNSHSYALSRALVLGFAERTEEVSAAWHLVRSSARGSMIRQTSQRPFGCWATAGSNSPRQALQSPRNCPSLNRPAGRSQT
jgi:hypothetical protein